MAEHKNNAFLVHPPVVASLVEQLEIGNATWDESD